MGDENKGYSKISENKSNGKTDITFNNLETEEKSSASCYLTTACMQATRENFCKKTQ